MTRFVWLVVVFAGCMGEPAPDLGDPDCIGDDCDPDAVPAPPGVPCIAIDASVVDFGEIRLGKDDPVETVTLGNSCAGTLQISDLIFAQQDQQGLSEFELVDPPTLPAMVEAGESLALGIRVVTDRSATLTDLLTIMSNDPNFPGAVVELTARVVCEKESDCDGALAACGDGIDNDGDGLVDFPEEPGCDSALDPDETDPIVPPVCADGIDNDGDGFVDWPADPECASAANRYESCADVASDSFGYRMCTDRGATSVCSDLSAGPSLSLGEEGTIQVPLGFSFDFYGTTFTDVFVGANGTLHFALPLSPPNNACLPAQGLGRAVLVWWDDLNPAGGGVWARTAGAAPDRRFEVQWRVPHLSGGVIDARAVLREGSDDIELCYVDTLAGPGLDNGISATAGIHSQFTFLEASCFAAGLQQDDVVRFQHP